MTDTTSNPQADTARASELGAVARFLALLESGARSEAERVVVALFRKARITGWVANHPVGG